MSEPILTEDAGQVPLDSSCWITVGEISVHINHFSDSVAIRLYVKDREAEDEALLGECEVWQSWAEDYLRDHPRDEVG